MLCINFHEPQQCINKFNVFFFQKFNILYLFCKKSFFRLYTFVP
jgi:hypothetical protein